MSSRLYEITCKDPWVIKGNRDTGYTLVNKETYDSFKIGGDVIGIEQILDNTFLVHRRIQRYRWQIYRIRIYDNEAVEEFEENFEHFDFLDDDTLMFDGRNKLYSISKNNRFDAPDNILFQNEVTLEESQDGKKVLCLKHEVISRQLPGIYDIVILDTSFKPVTQAFSSLRNQLITLTDDFKFTDLINEDEYYVKVISEYLYEENQNSYFKGKDALLKQCPLKS